MLFEGQENGTSLKGRKESEFYWIVPSQGTNEVEVAKINERFQDLQRKLGTDNILRQFSLEFPWENNRNNDYHRTSNTLRRVMTPLKTKMSIEAFKSSVKVIR